MTELNIQLTPKRKELLQLLNDGKWHKKLSGIRGIKIGIKNLEWMFDLGFVEWIYVSKNPEKNKNFTIKARITDKGKYFLKHGKILLDWPNQSVIFGGNR